MTIEQCPLCGGELQRLDSVTHRDHLTGKLVEVARETAFPSAGVYLCMEPTCRHQGTLEQLTRRADKIREGEQITPTALLGVTVDAEAYACYLASSKRPPGSKGGGGGSKGRAKDQRGGIKLVGNEPWDMKHAEETTIQMLRGPRKHALAVSGMKGVIDPDHFRRIMAAWVLGELD